MFALNFNKEWRMNKAILKSFFTILIIIFLTNTTFYILLKSFDFAFNTGNILKAIWAILAGLSSMLGMILNIALMYFLLSKDLGKNKVHYSIFTPQSLLSWYLPKLVFLIIIQGLFALIDLGYNFFIFDIANSLSGGAADFDWKLIIIDYFTTTFNIGFFALFTLCMALYYSFRDKGLSWLLIVISLIIYFAASNGYTFYQQFQMVLNDAIFEAVPTLLINYGIKNITGLIFIVIAMYLFDQKIEY